MAVVYREYYRKHRIDIVQRIFPRDGMVYTGVIFHGKSGNKFSITYAQWVTLDEVKTHLRSEVHTIIRNEKWKLRQMVGIIEEERRIERAERECRLRNVV